MFFACLQSAPIASAEVLQGEEKGPGRMPSRSSSRSGRARRAPPSPRTAISKVVQTEATLGEELLPSPEIAFSRQLDRMTQKQAAGQKAFSWSSGSTGERDLDSDLDGPESRQISKEERFPCWTRLPYSVPGLGDKELPALHGLESGADTAVQSASRETSEVGAAQTKEERLQAQVHAFVSKAHKGMSVYLCDMESMLLSQCLFRIDEATTTLTLQTALARGQELQLKDLKSVVKDEAFKKRVPRLAHASGECLLLVFGDAPTETLHCLFFKDTSERNDFHTSLKVVRVMAARGAK